MLSSDRVDRVVYNPTGGPGDPRPFELSTRHDGVSRYRSYEEIQQLLFSIRDAMTAFEKENS